MLDDKNMIDENNEQVYYAVMVHGQPYGPKHLTPQAAEQSIQQLSEAHQSIAEVVPVNAEGKQVLFG